jgi:hypothetical protein
MTMTPKSKPPFTGPMSIQPVDRGWTVQTPLLPMMPSMTGSDDPKTPKPKAQLTRTEAVRFAKARILRRNSLRKQRQAQKGQCQPPYATASSVSGVDRPIQIAKVR